MQIAIEKPSSGDDYCSPLYPKECRTRKATYTGRLTAQISWWIDGANQIPFERSLGLLPIMVLFFKILNHISCIN